MNRAVSASGTVTEEGWFSRVRSRQGLAMRIATTSFKSRMGYIPRPLGRSMLFKIPRCLRRGSSFCRHIHELLDSCYDPKRAGQFFQTIVRAGS